MNLQFREPANETELKSLFDLRRNVYSMDPTLRAMARGKEITPFDLKSLHYGGFDGSRAIAYIRMVQDSESHQAPWVSNIADDKIAPAAPGLRFPFQMYAPDKTWNREFLDNLYGKKIGEAGKLAIQEDYRGTGVFEEFIRAFIQYCNETHEFDSGFGICTFALERFYKRMGFYRANGSRPFIHDDLPEAVMLQFDRPYTHISYPAAMAISKC